MIGPKLRLLAALLTLGLLVAACGGGGGDAGAGATPAPAAEPAETAPAADAEGEPDGQADSVAEIEEYLLAPEDATVLEADPGPVVTTGITGSEVSLPYASAIPVEEGPIGDPDRQYTFCFSQALIRHPWPVAQKESMMIEEEKHPNLEILYFNTDNDPLQQVKDLESCLNQKVDAILVWPHSVGPLTPVIERAVEAGFPVIGMERTIASDAYDTWVYLDNEEATRQLAEAAGEALGGQGVIAEVTGAVGSSPQILRTYGFHTALKELYPDIEIVTAPPTDYSRSQGLSITLDFLQANPDVDAFYVHSGEIAIGVYAAMEQLGKTDIPIFTIDGSKPEVVFVQEGKFTAIAPWTPLHGDVALRAAIRHVTGEDVPKNILLAQPPLITGENADEQLERAWGVLE